MDIQQARERANALKPDDPLTLNGEPFVVTSASNGTIEYCRPAHRGITGSYFRGSLEGLAEQFVKGTAA